MGPVAYVRCPKQEPGQPSITRAANHLPHTSAAAPPARPRLIPKSLLRVHFCAPVLTLVHAGGCVSSQVSQLSSSRALIRTVAGPCTGPEQLVSELQKLELKLQPEIRWTLHLEKVVPSKETRLNS
jgi:hypothetical protein